MKFIRFIFMPFIVCLTMAACQKTDHAEQVISDTTKTDPGKTDTLPASDTTTFYLKFEADGKTYLYKGLVQGNFNKKDASKNFDFSVDAKDNALIPGKNRMTLTGVSKDSLKTGIYYQNFGTKTDTTVKANFSQLTWYNSDSHSYSSWPKELGATLIADTRIKFTNITQNTMRGKFSGTVYIAIDAAAEKHVIAKGEFQAKRVY